MAELTRYVRTRDAQQAVEGHAGEIARAVGIPWQDGQKTHIRCPYSHHGGADDWRLNAKGRAICTCTGNKTDSPFDVVSKVEGLDFEASKIRCVEIIGRADLINIVIFHFVHYFLFDYFVYIEMDDSTAYNRKEK